MAKSIQKQLAEIERKLTAKINSAMQDEVAVEIVREATKQVGETVYGAYPEPLQYERTYKLMTSWENTPIDKGISIRNTREENGKYIPEVVETGVGYDYTGYGLAYEEPRPFIQNTRDAIKQKGIATMTLRDGLKNRGVKVGSVTYGYGTQTKA